MWPRNQSVFFSSTYRDLMFERRAVIQALRDAGFSVVAMEDLTLDSVQPFRWSTQFAQKADIFILLYDRSSGSVSAPDIAPGLPAMPYTYWEAKYAQHATAVQLVYQLHRPFPDWQYLVQTESEVTAYQSTLRAGGDLIGLGARPLYLSHRKNRQIRSTVQLIETVVRDARSCWPRVACHRLAPNVSRTIEYSLLNAAKWWPTRRA